LPVDPGPQIRFSSSHRKWPFAVEGIGWLAPPLLSQRRALSASAARSSSRLLRHIEVSGRQDNPRGRPASVRADARGLTSEGEERTKIAPVLRGHLGTFSSTRCRYVATTTQNDSSG
jgi:hypothetical protein